MANSSTIHPLHNATPWPLWPALQAHGIPMSPPSRYYRFTTDEQQAALQLQMWPLSESLQHLTTTCLSQAVFPSKLIRLGFLLCRSLQVRCHDTIIALLCAFSTVIMDGLDELPFRDTSRRYSPLPTRKRHFPNQSCPWLTGDWKSCVHPEGALYLYNDTDNGRTYTEANIDENVFSAVDGCVSALYDDLLRDDSGDIGIDDIELVVQLKVRQTEVYCQYYFVDHKARILFWLHDPSKATEILFGMLPGVYDLSHMGYALEEEYWVHCERYPNHRLDRVKLVKELRELVIQASAEMITTDISLSPFDTDELSRILELINHIQENAGDDIFPHSIFVIARFMHYFEPSFSTSVVYLALVSTPTNPYTLMLLASIL
ncbi:hypothetical protein M405DRAFT_377978 [Rhizopogon salebrosus TDB-379]|nr:hypothetical protein M405DRAFT_377978 [Rhizopogon salebrosus TDB-379]